VWGSSVGRIGRSDTRMARNVVWMAGDDRTDSGAATCPRTQLRLHQVPVPPDISDSVDQDDGAQILLVCRSCRRPGKASLPVRPTTSISAAGACRSRRRSKAETYPAAAEAFRPPAAANGGYAPSPEARDGNGATAASPRTTRVSRRKSRSLVITVRPASRELTASRRSLRPPGVDIGYPW